MTKRILIVEDERIVAESLRITLRDIVYAVVGVASTGEEAVRLAEAKKPDLILMDVFLSGEMTGIDAAEKIRSVQQIPVVYLTAYADEKTIEQAKITEPFGYLIKPFEERELHATIEMAIYKSAMERRLRESEERYKDLAESITDVFFAMDRDLKYTYWNKASEEVLGVEARNVVGKTFQDLFPELKGTETEQLYREQVLAGESRTFVNRFENGGKVFYLETRTYPSRGGLSVFVRDVTERKEMEDALSESEERYRNIFESAVHGIFQSTPEGRFLSVNPTYARMLGYGSPSELIEVVQNIARDLFVRPGDRTIFTELLEERGVVERFEAQVYKKNGEKIWISSSARTVRDKDGATLYYEGFVEDISGPKEAEEKIRKSSDQLRLLNARLAEAEETERRRLARELHDLVGQNLTALSINLNILKGQLPAGLDEKLDIRIEDSLNLVEETVDNIRDVMAELRPPVLDDYGLLAALRWYGKRFAGRTGLTLSIEGKELEPRLSTSTEMVLFKIALEALTNIAKHGQARRVEVLLEDRDGRAILTVADDGVGFDVSPMGGGEVQTWGLQGMRERADSIGGILDIESVPGKGTRIITTVKR